MKLKDCIDAVWLLLGVVGMSSCSNADHGGKADVTPDEKPKVVEPVRIEDLCTAVLQSEFESVAEHTVGMGEHEPVMGRLGLTFNGSIARFNIADMSFNAPYECRDGVIKARWKGREIEGRYNQDHTLLIWNGMEYRPVH